MKKHYLSVFKMQEKAKQKSESEGVVNYREYIDDVFISQKNRLG